MALSNTHKHIHTHLGCSYLMYVCTHAHHTPRLGFWKSSTNTHGGKKQWRHLKSCSELLGSRKVEWAGKGPEIRNDNPAPDTGWFSTSIRPVAQVSTLRLLAQACLDTITFPTPPTQPWTWTWVLSRCERWRSSRSCWFWNLIQWCLYFIAF